ncbi:hypothetical protein Q8W71_13070 [Methylobacterium sp. NEAU 140]|uniref:hypothetical protein n=1 Tax=Methylobacterium sp. NEAU 140 TaxID=3064945 RepID=UPI002736E26C|nr:hypothetical protein [Methylobacterium sp. NEAU 140]MDP4023563.1 hypothetical protein [Methylobacterium sp. NEAU 140]
MFDRKTVKGFCFGIATAAGVTSALYAGLAGAQPFQPHMDAALSALSTARQQLEVATPNKGGHRERAISLVNAAIEQVQAGIAYAD